MRSIEFERAVRFDQSAKELVSNHHPALSNWRTLMSHGKASCEVTTTPLLTSHREFNPLPP